MYAIYFQMLQKLIQYPNAISYIEHYREFVHTMIELHRCLESTCQQNRFQLEFFTNTILLQDILQDVVLFAIQTSSRIFFDDLFLELSFVEYPYASLVVLFRCIEILTVHLTAHINDLLLYWIDRLVMHLFHVIDQCHKQLVLPALLPSSFAKIQVDYGSLYDRTYCLLMKLVQYQPMQIILTSMTHLIQTTNEHLSTISTSNQLASEVIIQSYLLYYQLSQCQELYALFLGQLLQNDCHPSLVQHLLTLPNICSVKFRAYEHTISSDRLSIVMHHLSSSSSLTISMPDLSLIFPNHIEHLYPFVRLFQSELTSTQSQYTLDTCLYTIQHILSLPIMTESVCRHFQLTLRLLTYMTTSDFHQEQLKCLLGQLTHLVILIDGHTANDMRLEFLRVFTCHINLLDDNDLARLLDFLLINPIESTPSSIAFHLTCLDLLDAIRQRSSRSSQITDLTIQLIVRYGNEHQCNHLLKANLMVR
jgi:hypothetical protein